MSHSLETIDILNAMPLACYTLDSNANFSFINDKALRFFKMTEDEMLGKNVWKLFPDSAKTNYYEKVNEALIKKQNTNFEYISVFTRSWIKLTVSPIKSGVLVTFTPINKDNQTENLYRTLIENTPDVVTKWTKDLKLSYGNTAFEIAAGTTLAKALGKSHEEIWPNTDVKPLVKKASNVLKNGNDQTIIIPFSTNGNQVFYDIKLCSDLTINGKVDSVIAISRDITNLKNSQDAFNEELRNKYKSLFNSINQGFCIIEIIWDDYENAIDYRFIEANPAFQRQTGIAEYEGKTIKEILPAPESYWFKIYGEVAKTQKSAHFELPASLINGWYEVEAFPIPELGENIVGILFNDITKRKKAEEILREDELKELEKKQQKEILKATLITQNEERQRIAEMLHNGLGQVLYGVKTNLERLKLNDPDANETNVKVLSKSKELLGMCIQESRRISHELMPSILEDFGLKVSIKDICTQLKGNTNFNCTFSGLKVEIDKYLQLAIYRIVQELALNIMKHANATHAGINISVKGDYVHVTVKDNGIGFDEVAQKAKGIGLKTVESKVKLLHGKIDITSVPKQTVIHIQFPL